MKLFKTLINNGFFILAILLGVTLYLAYGQKQANLNAALTGGHSETAHEESVSQTTKAAAGDDDDNGAAAARLAEQAHESAKAEPTEEEKAKTDDTPSRTGDDAAQTETADATAKPTATVVERPAQTQSADEPAQTDAEQLRTTPTAAADASASGSDDDAETTERNDELAATTAAEDSSGQAEEESSHAANGPAARPADAHSVRAETAQPDAAAKAHQAAVSITEGRSAADSDAAEAASSTDQARADATTRSSAAAPSSAAETTQADASPARRTAPAKATARATAGFDPETLKPEAVLSAFSGPRQALQAAQAAERQGDLSKSARIYASLLHFYPRADLAGRLGNVLWKMDEKKWARRAWRTAARLLIREGRIDVARAFARNIRKADPALSEEILKRLPPADERGKATPRPPRSAASAPAS